MAKYWRNDLAILSHCLIQSTRQKHFCIPHKSSIFTRFSLNPFLSWNFLFQGNVYSLHWERSNPLAVNKINIFGQKITFWHTFALAVVVLNQWGIRFRVSIEQNNLATLVSTLLATRSPFKQGQWVLQKMWRRIDLWYLTWPEYPPTCEHRTQQHGHISFHMCDHPPPFCLKTGCG